MWGTVVRRRNINGSILIESILIQSWMLVQVLEDCQKLTTIWRKVDTPTYSQLSWPQDSGLVYDTSSTQCNLKLSVFFISQKYEFGQVHELKEYWSSKFISAHFPKSSSKVLSCQKTPEEKPCYRETKWILWRVLVDHLVLKLPYMVGDSGDPPGLLHFRFVRKGTRCMISWYPLADGTVHVVCHLSTLSRQIHISELVNVLFWIRNRGYSHCSKLQIVQIIVSMKLVYSCIEYLLILPQSRTRAQEPSDRHTQLLKSIWHNFFKIVSRRQNLVATHMKPKFRWFDAHLKRYWSGRRLYYSISFWLSCSSLGMSIKNDDW